MKIKNTENHLAFSLESKTDEVTLVDLGSEAAKFHKPGLKDDDFIHCSCMSRVCNDNVL